MILRSLSVAIFTLAGLHAEPLSLSGEWRFALDPQDLGLSAGPQTWNFPDTIQLPGSTASQGKGDPLQIQLNLQKPAMQHLHQKFSYIGPAWYQRTVSIPAGWKGKDIILTLERVLWESRVWVDGKPVGEPRNSVSTPHRYELSSALTPGNEHFRTLAPDLLYTSTSYAFSPRGQLPGTEDDFFISQQTKSAWVRGQGFLNSTFPSTDSDYAEGLECLKIPLVTHEVGQYVVYPNLAELPDNPTPETVSFPEPLQIRFVRLSASSSHTDQPLASIAEVEPIPADPGDVRDLGIIPGFND